MKSPAEKLAAKKPAAVSRPELPEDRVLSFPGCKLREYRESLRLTQREVEEGTGINNVAISRIEKGAGVHLVTARKLAAFFGCSVDDLWPID